MVRNVKPVVSDAQWPKTVDEAVQILLTKLSEKAKETLKNTPPEDLIKFHYSLGMYIRNQFGLWTGNEALVPSDPRSDRKAHPDSVSMLIIKKLHYALGGET